MSAMPSEMFTTLPVMQLPFLPEASSHTRKRFPTGLKLVSCVAERGCTTAAPSSSPGAALSCGCSRSRREGSLKEGFGMSCSPVRLRAGPTGALGPPHMVDAAAALPSAAGLAPSTALAPASAISEAAPPLAAVLMPATACARELHIASAAADGTGLRSRCDDNACSSSALARSSSLSSWKSWRLAVSLPPAASSSPGSARS